MAYGLLAGVDPIVGIYTGFFPVLLYVFLGTMPHNSMGTFAVISILCSKPIIRLSSSMDETAQNVNLIGNGMMAMNGTIGHLEGEAQYTSLEVATAVAFCVGVIQFIMGMVRLGNITAILTDVLISAFTVGASMHVFTSQIKHILSVKVDKYIGAGRIVKIWINIAQNITSTNLVSLSVSVVSVAFLLLVSIVIGPKVKTKCRFPIPSQLVLVILGTVISAPLDLSTIHQVKTIGNISSIPTGLPQPSIPRLSLIPQVFMDSIPVAIISYVIGQSLGTMFGAKHGYTVDPNQELIAQGASNIFGGFFSCLPMASSLARSLVQEDSGGKSLFTAVASSSFLLVVLLWIGPIFEPLPVCILASIILASLKGVIQKMADFKKYWDRSRWDGFVWMATFLSTVLIDVDMGLVVGIGASMIAVMFRGCIPKVVVLQQDPMGEAWLDRRIYRTSNNGAKIMQVSGPIHFLTSGYLELQITREMEKSDGSIQSSGELTEVVETKEEITEILKGSMCNIDDSGINLSESINYTDDEDAKNTSNYGQNMKVLDVSNLDRDIYENDLKKENTLKGGTKDIVLDLSQVTFIDMAGAKTVQRVTEQIVNGGGKVAISGVNFSVAVMLDKANINKEARVYPTYKDAVAFW